MPTPSLLEVLQDSPVIAAIKDDGGFAAALSCPCRVVFLLQGDVCDLPRRTQRIADAGKLPFVHLDLMGGLAPDEAAVDYLAAATQAAGVLSTRAAVVRRAHHQGLLAVQRFFLLDSMALQNTERQVVACGADMVEVLPGPMPKVIRSFCHTSPLPVIAGGLIQDKEDIFAALAAGAVAVSTTEARLWHL